MTIDGIEYLTSKEVSEQYGLSKGTPYEWVSRKTIPCYRYYIYGEHEVRNEEDFNDPLERGRHYVRIFKREDVERKILGMRGRRICSGQQ